MSFFPFVYPREYFSEELLVQSFFTRKRLRLPLCTKITLDQEDEFRGRMILSVDGDDTGAVYVPYLHKRYGLTFFSTETLKTGSRPYHLLRELVRGQLSRILRKKFDWEFCGLRITRSLAQEIKQSIRKVANLITMDQNTEGFDEITIAIFETLVDTSYRLHELFLDQALEIRQSRQNELPALLGFRTGRYELCNALSEKLPLQDTFQIYNPVFSWKEIEPEQGCYCWDIVDQALQDAKDNGWTLILGPLIRWSPRFLPHWILEQLDDLYEIRKRLFRYFDLFLERYSFITHWVVASGISSNLGDILVSKRIEWADAIARKIRKFNPDAEIYVGMDQPLGDLLRFESTIAPLEIADEISGNPYIDGYFLELNIGLGPQATAPRDIIEMNRALDLWSLFGKKLFLSYSVPSKADTNIDFIDDESVVFDNRTQQEYLQKLLLSFLTRRSVAGISWSQLEDTIPAIHPDQTQTSGQILRGTSENSIFFNEILNSIRPPEIAQPPEQTQSSKPESLFPHSGLISIDGTMKPAYHKLMALQHIYLDKNPDQTHW